MRIATHPRASERPLSSDEAWGHVTSWLDAPIAWTPVQGDRHAEILGDLIGRQQVGAGLVTDAQLAALAIEHGLTLCSADTDFARFPELRWHNPLTD